MNQREIDHVDCAINRLVDEIHDLGVQLGESRAEHMALKAKFCVLSDFVRLIACRRKGNVAWRLIPPPEVVEAAEEALIGAGLLERRENQT